MTKTVGSTNHGLLALLISRLARLTRPTSATQSGLLALPNRVRVHLHSLARCEMIHRHQAAPDLGDDLHDALSTEASTIDTRIFVLDFLSMSPEDGPNYDRDRHQGQLTRWVRQGRGPGRGSSLRRTRLAPLPLKHVPEVVSQMPLIQESPHGLLEGSPPAQASKKQSPRLSEPRFLEERFKMGAMRVHGLMIRPDKSVSPTILRSLADYKAALEGCYLEHYLLAGGSMYVDEEALVKQYDPSRINYVASAVVSTIGRIELTQWILGSVLVVGPPDLEGWDTNITTDVGYLVHNIERLFRDLSAGNIERVFGDRAIQFR